MQLIGYGHGRAVVIAPKRRSVPQTAQSIGGRDFHAGHTARITLSALSARVSHCSLEKLARSAPIDSSC